MAEEETTIRIKAVVESTTATRSAIRNIERICQATRAGPFRRPGQTPAIRGTGVTEYLLRITPP